MLHIFFNPLSDNCKGADNTKEIEKLFEGEDYTYYDITKEADIYSKINSIIDSDVIFIAGGDGTLNRFVNDISGRTLDRDIFFFPCGSGNDFRKDIKKYTDEKYILVNKYIEDLPYLSADGIKRYFINGVGCGLDGYCCSEINRIRKKSKKHANYVIIAVKGLLYKYKTTHAKITVDGVVHDYKKVWLAPVMKGRYFGGGVMIAPDQDRLDESGTISVVVAHDFSRLGAVPIFPKIFGGTHVKHKKVIDVLTGSSITVEFENAAPMQIDGDTIEGIDHFTVTAGRSHI